MKKLEHIKKLLANKKQLLFKNYPIKSLAIFGSYARNEQNSLSDVDFLVEFHKKISVEFIDLANELEQIMCTKVDLVSINGIKEKYLQSISSDLYSKQIGFRNFRDSYFFLCQGKIFKHSCSYGLKF